MTPLHAALLLFPILAVEGHAESQQVPQPLPSSSIAAVIGRAHELNLTPAQVKELADRDAALQKQLRDLREQLGSGAAGPPNRAAVLRAPGPPAPGSRHGGRGGAGDRHTDRPPDRAGELQRKLDDADTAAWLSAEEILGEAQREPARAVAESYREARADEQETKKKRSPDHGGSR